MKPKASFVIPAYNAEAFIAETLESCLKQTEKKIEIVVVNDGSTDGTADVVSYYLSKDGRIKLINQRNEGRTTARNVGISEAKADVIFTQDADDISYPERVSDTLAAFKKTKADIVYSSFHTIDAIGQIIEDPVIALPFDYEKVKKEWFTYICHSTMAFKKKVFDKVQYTTGDYDKHAIDDWKFQIDAYQAGFKFAPVKKVLAAYRIIPKVRDEDKIKELKSLCLK
jgi:glycosyltransferase involved in cell wall biosynthesis